MCGAACRQPPGETWRPTFGCVALRCEAAAYRVAQAGRPRRCTAFVYAVLMRHGPALSVLRDVTAAWLLAARAMAGGQHQCVDQPRAVGTRDHLRRSRSPNSRSSCATTLVARPNGHAPSSANSGDVILKPLSTARALAPDLPIMRADDPTTSNVIVGPLADGTRTIAGAALPADRRRCKARTDYQLARSLSLRSLAHPQAGGRAATSPRQAPGVAMALTARERDRQYLAPILWALRGLLITSAWT